MNFIILHGTIGNPNHNWYPSVATELEKLGHHTMRPQLPTPEGQNLPTWMKTISETIENEKLQTDQLVFVAHSMSPLAVCHYLTMLKNPVCACFFVAGFSDRLPDTPEPYPTLNNPFVDTPINWKRVKKNSLQFVCFGSDNDPYVPLDITQKFARNLSAEFHLVPNAGHFNISSGYKDFPFLVSVIKEKIGS